MQAYFEWMPMREPESGDITSAVWRSFSFGDVATIYATETRLTGRSPTSGWSDVISATTDPDERIVRAPRVDYITSGRSSTMGESEARESSQKDLDSLINKARGRNVVMDGREALALLLDHLKKGTGYYY